jgi:hypothetical protein
MNEDNPKGKFFLMFLVVVLGITTLSLAIILAAHLLKLI